MTNKIKSIDSLTLLNVLDELKLSMISMLEIVDSLPITKDRVTVIPGMLLWKYQEYEQEWVSIKVRGVENDGWIRYDYESSLMAEDLYYRRPTDNLTVIEYETQGWNK